MRPPKLCVTVTADTVAELRERRDRVTHADLVELRLDSVRDPSAAGALAGRRGPVIVTCRPTWEGGHFTGSEEERKRILRDAITLGAEYVDIEWKAGFTDLLAERGGHGVVLSTHEFGGVPSDLVERAAAMRATGAEVVKIAIMAHRLSDCLALLPIARDTRSPTVVIAMGEAGLPTRVLASRFGSCWTYAGEAVAPGQIPASKLCEQFSFRSLAERTALYGVVGRPVAHSVSPAMHNAAFRATRLDAVYLPLAAADFQDFLTFASVIPVEGVSVTAPFKVDAFEHAAESDPVGRRVNSVNTLRRTGHKLGGRRSGSGSRHPTVDVRQPTTDIRHPIADLRPPIPEWEGCNTDVAGFLVPLQSALRVQGLRATVLGAGGAARAAAEALGSAGALVTIVARRHDRAEEVARRIGVAIGSWPPAPGSWDVLVNATPVGTSPDVEATPLPGGPFTGRLVYDLVYNPAWTRLLRDADKAGCRTLGGLDMLVAQAQLQFEWWTGSRLSERILRDAALDALGEPSTAL